MWMFALKKNEAGLVIFVVGAAEGKGIQVLVEFDFAYAWSCLPWSVFQQHLTSKNVLTNPPFLCLKSLKQRITQIVSGVHHPLLCIKLQVICWVFLVLLPGTCCSSSGCKTASAMPVLTWKCCFSCGSRGNPFLLPIKYPCYFSVSFHSLGFPPCW